MATTTKEDFARVGEKIKQARKQLQLSETQMAIEIGCSQQTINVIEAGKAHGKFFCSYLLFLKNQGIDLRSIFDV